MARSCSIPWPVNIVVSLSRHPKYVTVQTRDELRAKLYASWSTKPDHLATYLAFTLRSPLEVYQAKQCG